MLDLETRKRIDNARDILVGKVPDPKSQVEQITIALIYKFMDDMDKEAEELGGKATFFKGEFEKYAWSNIFDPKLGGYELINLYGEAITKMNQNKYLPQLFRDIFKNAFLPYRDPETLKSFLKEINDFKYDHSERLGDAFEYLLSVLGVQGDAGSLRTPRHIIDFIVEVTDPKKNETILDPACGTAGFLISSYKHILKQTTKEKKGDLPLTPDDRKRLINNFVGYDISPDMVRLSLVNMYLHGFQNPKIYEYDSLTSDERWNETFDVILANPPFMTPRGGIRPHKRFSIQANRSEVLFVDYIMEHLSTDGRAGVIVPEGIIFQSANAYKTLRKMLVENNYLYAVVSLPAGVFNPYSGVKTSILLMDKTLAKRADNVLFVKIENDGFDLGAQRKDIDKNNLPEAAEIIKTYKDILSSSHSALDAESVEKQLDSRLRGNDISHIVPKSKLAKSGDYNLTGDRYKERVVHIHKKWPMFAVEEIIDDIKYTNKIQKSEFLNSGRFPIIDQSENYIAGYWNEEADVFKINKPIVVFGDHTRVFKYLDFDFVLGADGVKLLQTNEKVNPKYFYYILQSLDIRNLGYSRHFKELRKMKIPLPPLSVQQEIVAEIEGYQKIIDGAKQIVEHYKPKIRIDESWKMVELGEVCDISTGKLNANAAIPDGQYPFFTCSKDIFKIDTFAFDCEAVLLSGNNASGDFDVKHYKGRFNAYQRTYVITIKKNYLNRLEYQLLKIQLGNNLKQLKDKSIGGLTKYLTLNMITTIPIPLPPLDIQKQIVAQIEEEQKLVEANKKLIEIFENKIKTKIAEVWGAEYNYDSEPEMLMAAEKRAKYQEG